MSSNKKDYSHDEFVKLVSDLNEEQLKEMIEIFGGYPLYIRKALDERLKHIPIIQAGAAVVIRNEYGEILLQERADKDLWGLPGGCQELGENLRITAVREVYEETGLVINPDELVLIDTLSGKTRRNTYPNGDVVYNNTTLYLIDVLITDTSYLKGDEETKSLAFFSPEELPDNIMDIDLVVAYLKTIGKKRVRHKINKETP